MKLFKALKKSVMNFQYVMTETDDEPFGGAALSMPQDRYLCHAWVNIAVGILIRNVARANYVITRGGNEIKEGRLYELFRRPNALTSGFDLWKETAAWWSLEGEAFWWFGSAYSGGIPHELFVLDPRKM
jgi:hypothetical protein